MSAVVLFDGVCNFCNSSVNFIIRRDPDGYFKFAALQSEAAARLAAENGFDPDAQDSIILIEDGRVRYLSTAALMIARRLEGRWPLFYVLIYVPAPVRDLFYRLFARYRYTLFGERNQCMIPTPQIRDRFLD